MSSLPRFRPATPEEIEAIRKDSDLGPGCTILAMDNPEGSPDIVVLRQCFEVDPVFYAETSSTRRRAMMMAILENMLAFQGVPAYYFNVPADDQTYRDNMKTWGAEEISKAPEIRFKKQL